MTIESNGAGEALAAYLARIGFVGEARPDLPTLRQMHRRHVETIPFENLDVQLGRPLSRDSGAAFDKIVGRRRGGWCFEMNGLFAAMLEAVGFTVRRLAGAVMREKAGDAMIGNHLVLLVDLDRTYVADVGGTGLFEPAPLAEGPIRQGFRRYSLERLEDGWWRFRNHPGAMPPSFDFSPEMADETLLDQGCHWLQTDSESPFVIHAIVQRQYDDRMESLVGRTHSTIAASGTRSRVIESESDYRALVGATFGLALAETPALWQRVRRAPMTDFLATM